MIFTKNILLRLAGIKVACILSNTCKNWKQDGEMKPILWRTFLFYLYLFNHFPPILYAVLQF